MSVITGHLMLEVYAVENRIRCAPSPSLPGQFATTFLLCGEPSLAKRFGGGVQDSDPFHRFSLALLPWLCQCHFVALTLYE
jgi:hypothetical protein